MTSLFPGNRDPPYGTTVTYRNTTLAVSTTISIQEMKVMNVGTQVVVNGRLASGRGVVEAWIGSPSIDAMMALPRKLQGKVRNQPFPQCWVRLADGRLMHYNGADITGGMVLIPDPVPAQSAPANTAAAPDNLTLVGIFDNVAIYAGNVG